MAFLNKVVVVTGGASGIGAASVRAFCEQGACLIYINMVVWAWVRLR